MSPADSCDFLRAARQRLTTAEALLDLKYNLDAQYIGGYTIECALKALILHRTSEEDRQETLLDITSGAKMHRAEVLADRLRELGVRLPLELVRRLRRFPWDTALRYETGRRDTGETIAFLKTAKAILEWVEGQLQ